MAEAENAYVSAALSALREMGFEVHERSSVEGLSGLKHSFDLVARKPNRLVCVSVRPSTPLAILTEMAKSMDIRGEVIVAVLGEAPQGLANGFNGKRFKVVPVNDPRELAGKLRVLLAEP